MCINPAMTTINSFTALNLKFLLYFLSIRFPIFQLLCVFLFITHTSENVFIFSRKDHLLRCYKKFTEKI